ncbi:hypothetical protein E4L96_20690 [Massilia arenosa]|uniref:Uncharacterized protein n=1 Tax=Zemynaea arenosa TaxID=2561931 RepID=A0A4Y9RV73_9BURK|nr:hypothetical protein [Massilia arenosa]TFW11705.1 hypothetical protein E4L96_20690 [Massilia arenosa]
MPTSSRRLLAATLFLSATASAPLHAAATAPALDKYLPAKLAGWKTDGPFDDNKMFDHTITVTQTYSGKDSSGLDITYFRVLPTDRIRGIPQFEKARLGELPEGEGFASLQTIKDRKALVVYAKNSNGGKLEMVAGRCVITISGHGIKQDHLIAAAQAVDTKALDAACK